MTFFLNTLERTALSTWIRETESVFGYYFVLVIHNIGLALLVGSCAVITFPNTCQRTTVSGCTTIKAVR